jgi:hypothetical protein
MRQPEESQRVHLIDDDELARWIPVGERLPDNGRRVPVILSDKTLDMADYQNDKWNPDSEEYRAFETEVVFWYDLPSPLSEAIA